MVNLNKPQVIEISTRFDENTEDFFFAARYKTPECQYKQGFNITVPITDRGHYNTDRALKGMAEELFRRGFRNVRPCVRTPSSDACPTISYRQERYMMRCLSKLTEEEKIKQHWTRESELIFA